MYVKHTVTFFNQQLYEAFYAEKFRWFLLYNGVYVRHFTLDKDIQNNRNIICL